MDAFKYLFWILASYLVFVILLRVYWFARDRYCQISWLVEWLIALISCIGIYGVAYKIRILNQNFWWFILGLIFITSFLRLRSSELQTQLKQLTKKQRLFVCCLMVLFTLPLALGVLFNAANLTDIW